MKISFSLALIMYAFQLAGQVSEGGIPISFYMDLVNPGNLKSMVELEQIILPEISNDNEILKTDSISESSQIKRSYFGKVLDADIDLVNDSKEITVDGGVVKLYHIFSPSAYGLQFYFDRFNLSEGAKLFIYNEQKDMILGAFTHQNNNPNKNFGIQYITGNSVFIEYFVPNNLTNYNPELHINKIVHVFRPLRSANGEWGTSGTCNVNVACDEDTTIRELSHSVALILCVDYKNWYSYWCSGTLLNNTMYNKRPLFFSASHCADETRHTEGFDLENFDYSRWLFLFNYQVVTCNSNLRVNTNSVYGAKLLSVDDHKSYDYLSDHLLLELNTTAKELETYNVVYAGWQADEFEAYNTAYTKCIHHPSGDIKKISNAGIPASSSLNGRGDNQWEVYWNSGVTEPGSSGSPLFNDEYKVIGSLYGGSSSCNSTNAPDYFSKMSLAYEYGNLHQWLDPSNSGLKTAPSLFPETVTPLREDFIIFKQGPITGEYEIIIKDNMPEKSALIIHVFGITGSEYIYKKQEATNIIKFDMYGKPAGIYFFRLQYNYQTYLKSFIYNN